MKPVCFMSPSDCMQDLLASIENARAEVTRIAGLSLGIDPDADHERRNQEMVMSRDRVEFTPGVRSRTGYGGSEHGDSYTCTHQALMDTMGMSHNQAREAINTRAVIRCRPSQFARFIIRRHDLGISVNGIKNLEPRLLNPEPKLPYIDVSEEKNSFVDYED